MSECSRFLYSTVSHDIICSCARDESTRVAHVNQRAYKTFLGYKNEKSAFHNALLPPAILLHVRRHHHLSLPLVEHVSWRLNVHETVTGLTVGKPEPG